MKRFKNLFFRSLIILFAGSLVFTLIPETAIQETEPNRDTAAEKHFYPSEWMDYQRTYPHPYIKPENYREAMEYAGDMHRSAIRSRYDIEWEFTGPTNIGGRITDLAIHPDDLSTIYLGGATGGVLKTTDGGQNWENVFTEVDVISIGDLAIDPNNPDVIYAGTGEANSSSYSFIGNGVYKSTDAGESWFNTGLTASAYIGRIIVDYGDSETVFAAACGNLFSPGGERGIYKSTDGGENWDLVLFVNDVTSAIDLVQHPENPDILYATMWERLRGLTFRQSFGDGSGVWKSEDGGDTWTELTNGLPTGDNVGRIGIDIAISNPDVLYTFYDMPGGVVEVYRTDDGGDSWIRTNDGVISGNNSSFGWYFGQVRVDPADEDIVYIMGVGMYRTMNGGESWDQISGYFNFYVIHVDNHAMWIDPASGRIFQGNDGGFYFSDDKGDDWTKINNVPLTQFYDIEIDYLEPYRIYGGTQDNNTIRTLTGSTDDWQAILGGDGFYSLVDYQNNDIIYAESQYGGLAKSTDGGNNFDYIAGQMNGDRINWSAPLIMHPTDPQTLYFGTYRVWKTTIGGWGWTAVSDDITDGDDGSPYHTVTTLAISSLDPDIVLAGTDDGNVNISLDGGDSWSDISDGLPDRWITRVATDPFDTNTIYATVSGFRWDEQEPHVLMSNDLGKNWTDISGNLPQLPVNIVLPDPDIPGYLFVGTDAGVYFTEDYGYSWVSIMGELPNVPITAMKIHKPTRKLVIGTYGISSYALNLDDIVSVAEGKPDEIDFNIYPNPVGSEMNIQLSEGAEEIKLFDLQGRLIRHAEIQQGQKQLTMQLEDLAPGTYIVHVQGSNRIGTRKIIKK